MGWIKLFFVNIFTFLAVAPFISFFILWLVFFSIYKERKKATTMAMDVTTLFLVISVSAMYNEVFNSGIGFWLIALFFLLATGLTGNAQHRLKGQLDFMKIYKVVWRLGFLLLSLLYIIFAIIGIIKGLF